MAHPRNRRGFRPIVVDEVSYCWRFDEVLHVVLDSESSDPGQRLVVDWGWVDWLEPGYRDLPTAEPQVVTPKFVALAIRAGLASGWEPTERGQEFRLRLANGEFSEETPDD